MREEIKGNDLELVTGGKLKYDNGKIWVKGDSENVYHYDNLEAVANYLKDNWTYKTGYDQRALEMLEQAGLISK